MRWISKMLRVATGSAPLKPQPPLRAPALSTGDPELDPLASFLRAWFADSIEAGKVLVIEDRTAIHTLFMRRSYQDYIDLLLGQGSEQVPAEMIRDLGDKNRESCAVWPELSQYVPARLLSGEEFRAIFEGGPVEGWRVFYEKYPDAAGIITVSRVGLNREQDRALFYMAWGWGALAAYGRMYVLAREGDAWVQQPVRIGGIWVS